MKNKRLKKTKKQIYNLLVRVFLVATMLCAMSLNPSAATIAAVTGSGYTTDPAEPTQDPATETPGTNEEGAAEGSQGTDEKDSSKQDGTGEGTEDTGKGSADQTDTGSEEGSEGEDDAEETDPSKTQQENGEEKDNDSEGSSDQLEELDPDADAVTKKIPNLMLKGSANEETEENDSQKFSYIDENETIHTLEDNEYSILTSMSSSYEIGTNGQSSFVAIQGSVTINGQLTVHGLVSIILCDGATLNCKGLIVPEAHQVDIYCQSGKTGKLISDATDNKCAGIGGKNDGSVGNIKIHGGTINATGAENAAGIGSGESNRNTPYIVISGGTVTANGGRRGAAIGGGNEVAGGRIVINGGVVNATGGLSSAGIGGGKDAGGDIINISGGNITTKGGDVDPQIATEDGAGAGIGGGDNHSGGTITISGGTIEATGGDGSNLAGSAAGIGGGDNGTGGVINISGGNIRAYGGGGYGYYDGSAGIGGGCSGNGGSITISGGKIIARGGNGGRLETELLLGNGGAGIGGGKGASGGNITITGGDIDARGGHGLTEAGGYGAGIGGGDGGSGGSISISLGEGGRIQAAGGLLDSTAIGSGRNGSNGSLTLDDLIAVRSYDQQTGNISDEPVIKKERIKTCRGSGAILSVCTHDTIIKYVYVNNDGHQRICRYCYVEHADKESPLAHTPDESGRCTLCENEQDEAVYYYDENQNRQVCKDYRLLEKTDLSNGLREGWYVIKETEKEYDRRFLVIGDVHLIICNGTNTFFNEGIYVPMRASLTIYSQDGTAILTVKGSENCAGIGSDGTATCGNISINGSAKIIVQGGKGAAAIGGGKGGGYQNITISHANITATGGEGGAAIGGGQFDKEFSTNSGTIRITESMITATGGNGGAGIGGGYHQNGGTIVIDGAQPPPSCYYDHDNEFPWQMMADPALVKITAKGGRNKDSGGGGAGIGGGEDGHGGSVTVKGGYVLSIGGSCGGIVHSGGGAGIGGGDEGNGGTITFDGGMVLSSGGVQDSYSLKWGGGAGIGGGNNGSGGTITINNGCIGAGGGTSTSAGGGGAGIGGGDNGNSGTITINGGKVLAEVHSTKYEPAAIGSGYDGDCGTITINGGYVETRYADNASIGKYNGNGGTIVLGDDRSVYYNNAYVKRDERVAACRKSGNVIIDKCTHPDAMIQIATPANEGHTVYCDYCKEGLDFSVSPHELDEHAVCTVCGYHGVILHFDPGTAESTSGTMEDIIVTSNTEVILPKSGYQSPAGYEFTGWKIDDRVYGKGESYITPIGKSTLTTVTVTAIAQWEEKGHDWGEPVYTWNDDYTECIAERICQYDDSHKETETGTVIRDVTKEPTLVEDGECVYTATFTNTAFSTQKATQVLPRTKQYIITFVDWDGYELQRDKLRWNELPEYVKYIPHKEADHDYSYVFIGWEPEITSVTGNATYTAVYEKIPNPFDLTIDLNGGTLDGQTGTITTRYQYGDVITLPKPVKEGYQFSYWKGSKYYAGDSYTVTDDHTLTAIWETNKTQEDDTPEKSNDSNSQNTVMSEWTRLKEIINTGDDSNLGRWGSMLGVSVVLICLTLKLLKR